MLLNNYFVGTLDAPLAESLVLINKDDIVDVFIENFTTEPFDLTSASVPPLKTRLNIKTKAKTWLVKVPTVEGANKRQTETLLTIMMENTKMKLKLLEEPEKSLVVVYAKDRILAGSTGLTATTFCPNDVSYMLFEKAITMQLTVAFKDERAMRSIYFEVPNKATEDLPQLLTQLLHIPPVSVHFENALDQDGTTVESVYLLLCNRID